MAGFRHEGIGRLEALVDEAVLDPALWRDVVQGAADASGSAGAMLIRVDRVARSALSTDSMERCTERYFAEGWNKVDHRLNGMGPLRQRGVTVDQDFTTPEQFGTLPFYRDLLESHGLRWFAGVGFVESADSAWCLALQRTPGQGAFSLPEQESLVRLSGPLRRAALLVSMTERARMAGIVEAFDVIGRPAAVLSRDGRVVRSNAAFDGLAGLGVQVRRGRLVIDDKAAAREVEALASGRPPCAAFAVRAGAGLVAVIHPVPLPGPVSAAFAGGGILLLVSTPGQAPVADADLLRMAYRLTPGEARLAVVLAAGGSLVEAARTAGIAHSTARTHLKGVFAKMGIGSQLELVRAMHSLAGPARRGSPVDGRP